MNNNLQNTYLDILFANRNKAYGAYELRKNYDKRMLMSALLLSLAVLLFVGWNHFAPTTDAVDNTSSVLDGPVITLGQVDTKIYDAVEVKIEKPKAEAGRTAKTQNFTKAKIVKDNALTKPALKPLADDALAGPVDNLGLKDGKAIALDHSLNEGGDPANPMSKKGDEKGEPAAKLPTESTTDKPLDIVSEMPKFPGGDAALAQYLNRNLKYPNFALSNDIEGTVHLSFVVNTDGSIVDVKIVRGVAGGCSEEALRVVKGMPKWKAGVNNGHKVRVKMTIPIRFAVKQ